MSANNRIGMVLRRFEIDLVEALWDEWSKSDWNQSVEDQIIAELNAMNMDEMWYQHKEAQGNE